MKFIIAIGTVCLVLVSCAPVAPETAEEQVAKVKAACAHDYDPTGCEFREIDRQSAKLAADERREEDRRAGN